MLNMAVPQLHYVATVKNLDSAIATFYGTHQIEPFIHFTGSTFSVLFG